MKATIYVGLGSLREPCWTGKLDLLPREGDAVALPRSDDEFYRVSRVVFRLDWSPIEVEIYVR